MREDRRTFSREGENMKRMFKRKLIGGILLISLVVMMSACAAGPAETTVPTAQPEETKQAERKTSPAETTTEPETSSPETVAETETSVPETTVPAETSADPAASADIIVTDPRSRVYTTTYSWGENAEEKYTCILILTPPESEISETNEAGLIWEGWTYEFRNPGS